MVGFNFAWSPASRLGFATSFAGAGAEVEVTEAAGAGAAVGTGSAAVGTGSAAMGTVGTGSGESGETGTSTGLGPRPQPPELAEASEAFGWSPRSPRTVSSSESESVLSLFSSCSTQCNARLMMIEIRA